MVLTENETPAHLYDLVRAVFDVVRQIMKEKKRDKQSHHEELEQVKKSISLSELKMIKNLEILIDVLKKGSEKVGKAGEKEWKDVVEQQSFVLEEVIKMHQD